jgi:hypothetical protein
MNESENSTPASSAAPSNVAWPRPTLVALPPLRELTLQSGTITGVNGGAGLASGTLSF